MLMEFESDNISYSIILFLVVLLYGLYCYYLIQQNLRHAKEIDLPYIILPFYTSTLPWLIFGAPITSFLRCFLPRSLTKSWIDYMFAFWTWYLGYEPFERLGNDTIMTVAPGGITIWTCSPSVIQQIGARGRDFPKPAEYYKVLDIFGPNILSETGDEWKRARKAIAPSFNDANNDIVFDEAVHQATVMLQKWTCTKAQTIDFADDMKMLAFHILCKGAFGIRMSWSHGFDNFRSSKDDEKSVTERDGSSVMNFARSLLDVVENMKTIFIYPSWILRRMPWTSQIWNAHQEVESYMYDYMNGDIINDGEHSGSLFANSLRRRTSSNTSSSSVSLTNDGMIANMFATMVAGHETSGSTLYHALILLALNPEWQERMQLDIYSIFGDSHPSTWSYAEHIESLNRSSISAVINETLRLLPPANLIPKRTASSTIPQSLKSRGREIVIPPSTTVNVLVASAHRNPHSYPTLRHALGCITDINDFHPDRWLLTSPYFTKPTTTLFSRPSLYRAQTSFENIPTNVEKKALPPKLHAPPKGAFIPFSIGHRECIGKKFAQIEMLVVLAVLFRDFEVELVVKAVEDAKTAGRRLSKGEKWMKWEEEKSRVEGCLKMRMEHYMTMQLQKGLVDLRIVRRGEGNFGDIL